MWSKKLYELKTVNGSNQMVSVSVFWLVRCKDRRTGRRRRTSIQVSEFEFSIGRAFFRIRIVEQSSVISCPLMHLHSFGLLPNTMFTHWWLKLRGFFVDKIYKPSITLNSRVLQSSPSSLTHFTDVTKRNEKMIPSNHVGNKKCSDCGLNSFFYFLLLRYFSCVSKLKFRKDSLKCEEDLSTKYTVFLWKWSFFRIQW